MGESTRFVCDHCGKGFEDRFDSSINLMTLSFRDRHNTKASYSTSIFLCNNCLIDFCDFINRDLEDSIFANLKGE